MFKKKNIFRVLLLPTVIFSVALGIFRAYALVNCIEPDTGFYYSGTAVKPVFSVLVILALLFIFACQFFTRKRVTPESLDSEKTFIAFGSALCAIVYLAVFLYGVFAVASVFSASQMAANSPFGVSQSFFARLVNVAPGVTSNGIFFLIQVLLCVPACLNHFTICTKKERGKNKHYALLSLGETLFFAFRIVEVFMDTKTQINTSQRSLEIILLCAAMLFFMYESRFLVTAEGGVSIGRYYAAALGVICFTLIAAVPYLMVSVFWLYTPKFALVYVLECCVAVFAAARVTTLNDSSVQGE